ncbi:hypothetical protein [Streptomyces fructofermentans]|nr:hypothetical protein [Streptomyces fructofermentans]
MKYVEFLGPMAQFVLGYGLGRAHQWSRHWRTTPLKRRLERAAAAFRKPG